ncbi:Rft protein-domain-containing protein [Pilobolus umbonatus]|nr:Rft protein-domain-containing protein [Pilobolus umbonatus]
MDKHDKDTDSNLLSSTAKGASYLIMLQFVSRILTFSLNQIVLRFISAETLGIASVNLELLASTILFISREGFRSALIRTSGDNNTHSKNTSSSTQQQIINLAYIPTFIGLLMTLLTCSYYLSTITESDSLKYPHYRTSVVLYGIGSFIELLVEPLFILALNNLYFKLRVSIEGVAVFLKCTVTFCFTLYGGKEYSILSFALAQLSYGLVMMVGYVGFFLLQIRKKKMESVQQLIPQPIRKSSNEGTYYFDEVLLHLGVTMTKQSLLKHVLTEGDKMLISALSTLQDQGVYAFVVNYGSLVVRILFQPLEETGRTLFSKLHASNHNTPNEGPKTAANVLMIIIRLHVLLGYIFIFFATNYTTTLIDLLGGKSWSINTNAPAVLSVYCMYVPFMGINGITEAFVQAVATKQDLSRLSYYMITFSIIFMVSGFIFMYMLNLGAIGLVMANMVNLGVRILYSWNYIEMYFKTSGILLSVTQWFPHLATTLSFILSWVVTYWSKSHIGWYTLQQKMIHIAIGGAMFMMVSSVILWKERVLINDIRILLKKKQT